MLVPLQGGLSSTVKPGLDTRAGVRPGMIQDRSKTTGCPDANLRLGQDIKQFTSLLKVMLNDFIRSFEGATDPGALLGIWSQVAQVSNGTGPYYIAGKIDAFYVRQPDGNSIIYTSPRGPIEIEVLGGKEPVCHLQGTVFHRVSGGAVPNVFVSVPAGLDKSGVISRIRMVAALVGLQVSSRDAPLDDDRMMRFSPGPYPPGPGATLAPVPVVIQPSKDAMATTRELETIQALSLRWIFELRDGIEDVSDYIEGPDMEFKVDDMMEELERLLNETLTLAG
ncbi:hypothetical protein F4778DRAFT_705895 [Xylariomycetidae sp. FL2044]|nr:hypothetical protein F4778DRAFT_705895 [Xylariomycetidae sp. FL2044]